MRLTIDFAEIDMANFPCSSNQNIHRKGFENKSQTFCVSTQLTDIKDT